MELTAKLDKKGSECAKLAHYTVGKKGDLISGGFYMAKDAVPPLVLTIVFQRKGEKDAKC